MTPTKCCTKCGTEHPRTLEFFGPHRRMRDGLMSHCRGCDRARCHRYYRANTDARRKYDHNRRLTDVETRREGYREYYRANAAARRQYARQWRQNNPESMRALTAIRRARRLDQGTPATPEQRAAVRDVFDTARLAEAFTGRKFTVDHMVPLARGGSSLAENLQHLPWDLNAAKATKTHEEALLTVPGYAEWFRPLVWETPSFTIIPA